METRISIPELDFDYKLLKNRLRFYEQEVQIYLARLLSMKVQHQSLSDRFITELKEMVGDIQSLNKEIQLHEEEIAFYKKDYPINFQHQHYRDLVGIREKFGKLTKSYQDLVDQIDEQVHRTYLV
jgi:hypothetical protein